VIQNLSLDEYDNAEALCEIHKSRMTEDIRFVRIIESGSVPYR